MRLTILTPALNAIRWLPGCVASVADQAGVEIEHIVLDGGSSDGTIAWLKSLAPDGCRKEGGGRYILRWVSSPDQGMYDALNRGLDAATGEWIAWLNADEQYLEGTLEAVQLASIGHPEVSIWFGDYIMVGPDGRCLAWRRGAWPTWRSIAATHLYVPSCVLFFRRRFFDAGWRFSPGWRMVGDEELLVKLLQTGPKIGRIRRVLSAYIWTGTNLGLTKASLEEMSQLKQRWPRWLRLSRALWQIGVRVRRAAAGGFFPPRDLRYRLYWGWPPVLTRFEVRRPGWRWPVPHD